MSNYAVVFVSTLAPEVCGDQLKSVVAKAASFNARIGTNSVTFFDGLRMLTYIEGSADGVAASLLSMQSGSVHTDIIDLAKGSLSQLRLPGCPMLLLDVDTAQLRILVRADWRLFSQRRGGRVAPETGMEHMIAAVERCRQSDAA